MDGPLKILLLDDEMIVGKRLEPALAKCGYDVEFFSNPLMALERIEQKEFDILVADIYMDEMDGFQVIEKVLGKYPNIKIIVITGYAMMEIAREAMDKGAFDFIAKPFKPDDLRKIIVKAACALGYKADDGQS